MKEIFEKVILGNTILAYLSALIVFIVGVVVIKVFMVFIRKKIMGKIPEHKMNLIEFLLTKVFAKIIPLLYYGIFYFSISTLNLNKSFLSAIKLVGLGVLTFVCVKIITQTLKFFISQYTIKKEGGDIAKVKELGGLLTTINILIWAIAIIFFLDNIGFKITTVLAGLGIGGVAIALAAQTILADLFSYFAIFFDKPFAVGDFIIVDGFLGSVEYIGIKTTRIRSLSGEQVIFSNRDLTNSRIKNYKRMEKRRVVFQLGVVYQTPVEKLKEIPEVIENIIKDIADTQFDRCHFFSFGDFSLIFEIVYYVLSSDYNKYMDIQQEINLRIAEEFEKRQIEFAYPTQTIYLNK